MLKILLLFNFLSKYNRINLLFIYLFFYKKVEAAEKTLRNLRIHIPVLIKGLELLKEGRKMEIHRDYQKDSLGV